MKVQEIMTSDVKCCSPDTNLATAAKIMWECDCGAVPVTENDGKVVGIITDRDICIAAATRSRAEGEIAVTDVISKKVHACAPSDDVTSAMKTMKAQQVRRLPVVGRDGRLKGIISLHDIAVRARSRNGAVDLAEELLDTFIAITEPSRAEMALPA
jgi:CBS domain-containing protein